MSPMPGTTGVIHEHPAESNTAEDLAGETQIYLFGEHLYSAQGTRYKG